MLEVHVTHPAPSYRAEYDRIFQCPVVFDAEWNALRMHPDTPKFRVALQPRYVFGVLSERAEQLLKELEQSRTTRGRVEAMLMPILHTGDIGMDAIATKMAVSRQTLFRRLKAEDATFEKVLDDLRHRLVEALSRRPQGVGERDRLSRRLLRSRRVLPRLQALDRQEPPRFPRWRCLITKGKGRPVGPPFLVDDGEASYSAGCMFAGGAADSSFSSRRSTSRGLPVRRASSA